MCFPPRQQFTRRYDLTRHQGIRHADTDVAGSPTVGTEPTCKGKAPVTNTRGKRKATSPPSAVPLPLPKLPVRPSSSSSSASSSSASSAAVSASALILSPPSSTLVTVAPVAVRRSARNRRRNAFVGDTAMDVDVVDSSHGPVADPAADQARSDTRLQSAGNARVAPSLDEVASAASLTTPASSPASALSVPPFSASTAKSRLKFRSAASRSAVLQSLPPDPAHQGTSSNAIRKHRTRSRSPGNAADAAKLAAQPGDLPLALLAVIPTPPPTAVAVAAQEVTPPPSGTSRNSLASNLPAMVQHLPVPSSASVAAAAMHVTAPAPTARHAQPNPVPSTASVLASCISSPDGASKETRDAAQPCNPPLVENEEERRAIAVAMLLEIPAFTQRRDGAACPASEIPM